MPIFLYLKRYGIRPIVLDKLYLDMCQMQVIELSVTNMFYLEGG